MRRLRQISKKIVCAALLPAMLAGAIAISPKKVNAEEVKKPSVTLKLENLFHGENKFYSDKLRLTLDSKYICFTTDGNNAPGDTIKQSQTALDLKLVQSDKTKLIIGYAGNIAEKNKTGDYGISTLFSQGIGKLPVIGNSAVRLFELSSFKKNEGAMHRGTVTLLSDRIDAAYDLVHARNGNLSSRYFVAFHNDSFYLSLGKSAPNQVQAAFTNIGNKDIGVFALGDYNTENKVMNMIFWNSYGEADVKTTYTLGIGRLATSITNLPGIEVKKPILTDYLTFGGKTTHRLDVHTEPGKWNIANQLGFSINNTIAVGAGASISQEKGRELNVAPIVAGYFKPKILGQEVFLEFMLKDGRLGGYICTRFGF